MAITINGSTGIEMASDDSLGFGDIGLSADTLFSGRKNVIINGDFDVWQRGTGAFTTAGFNADRWDSLLSGSTTQSVSQSSFTVGQTDVPNEPKYYWTNVVTTGSGAGDRSAVYQKIESVRTLAGQTATLTFWAKADSSKDIAIELQRSYGVGGAPSSSDVGIQVETITLSASWQKFEITLNVPSISGKTLGTTHDGHIAIIFWFDAGSDFNARTNSLGNQSGTFDIAQVQLEKGSQATAFEKRSYGEELALCQRYYQRYEDAGSNLGIAGHMLSGSGSLSAQGSMSLPVALRSEPTITTSNLRVSSGSG